MSYNLCNASKKPCYEEVLQILTDNGSLSVMEIIFVIKDDKNKHKLFQKYMSMGSMSKLLSELKKMNKVSYCKMNKRGYWFVK